MNLVSRRTQIPDCPAETTCVSFTVEEKKPLIDFFKLLERRQYGLYDQGKEAGGTLYLAKWIVSDMSAEGWLKKSDGNRKAQKKLWSLKDGQVIQRKYIIWDKPGRFLSGNVNGPSGEPVMNL